MDTTKSLEALVAAAGDGDVDTVKNLIDTGSDVNSVDAHSLTPLLSASRHGHTQMVQFLVGKGADINKSDQEGDTPLIIAAIEGHVEIVQFLLEIGDDVGKKSKNGNTPLICAAKSGQLEVVQLLLEHGADINWTNQFGSTALLWAADCGHIKVVKFLLEQGAAIDLATKDEYTPLLDAVLSGHVDIVEFLLGQGADIHATTAAGGTALTHPNIVPFFGACDEGSTCFFVCEEAKNGKLLDYLYHAREEGRSLVWRKLLDAALGLHFLHERHIVHTDLKCNQILVSKDGVAMLTDFGLSFLTTEQSEDDKTVGAIRWKAPEVIRKGNPVAPNALSDVYSFGMCVVEAVTGDVPWGQHVPDPVVKFHVTRKKFIPRPKAFNSDAEWELVEKMCAFEPSERIKLSDAIEKIRGFAEEERFQERLRQMQQERPEDVEFAVPELPIRSKTSTMGAVRALTKMKSLGRSIRMRKGEGNLMAAA
ncbi:hypothetical protein JG687_00001103 [Phytophthora cactorum]|uniref:Protein kinase domain-containing protein n=1 Tax=Phytophthora cactorum TaxID=29920 RepID=A0A8T1UY89_9STRA|nr:hypothetical protein JG687_00001103 [Phytophthora cactorum]